MATTVDPGLLVLGDVGALAIGLALTIFARPIFRGLDRWYRWQGARAYGGPLALRIFGVLWLTIAVVFTLFTLPALG